MAFRFRPVFIGVWSPFFYRSIRGLLRCSKGGIRFRQHPNLLAVVISSASFSLWPFPPRKGVNRSPTKSHTIRNGYRWKRYSAQYS